MCVFLYGGNDANNMLIQNDTKGYANYSSVRGPLAIPQAQLLPLGSNGLYALNPNLTDIPGLYRIRGCGAGDERGDAD